MLGHPDSNTSQNAETVQTVVSLETKTEYLVCFTMDVPPLVEHTYLSDVVPR